MQAEELLVSFGLVAGESVVENDEENSFVEPDDECLMSDLFEEEED